MFWAQLNSFFHSTKVFSFSSSSLQGLGWSCTRKWVRTQLRELNSADQRDIPCHTRLCSAIKAQGKEKERNMPFGLQHISSQIFVTCTEALLSRRQLNICLPMGSSERIPRFAFLACATLLHFLNCLYLDSQFGLRFFGFCSSYFLTCLTAGNERETEWRFTCQLGSVHYSSHSDFFKKQSHNTGNISVDIC